MNDNGAGADALYGNNSSADKEEDKNTEDQCQKAEVRMR